MAKLTKTVFSVYTPASDGDPGFPGIPPSPGYWTSSCTTSTANSCRTTLQPVYGSCPSGGGLVVGGSCVVDYVYATICAAPITSCASVYVPPTAGRPAIPATPPTAAQLVQIFNEGWNSSAQSTVGMLPGKAVLFKVGTGSRSVLAGLAVEPWVPQFNTLPFGILFDGGTGAARVFENNVAGASLGSFWGDKEFLVGRSSDNFIVYMNYTDRITVTRRLSPAPPITPVHFFALQYRGGDVVIS